MRLYGFACIAVTRSLSIAKSQTLAFLYIRLDEKHDLVVIEESLLLFIRELITKD